LPSLIQPATRNASSALTETRSFSAISQTSLLLPFWTRSSHPSLGWQQLPGRVQSAPRVPSSTSPPAIGGPVWGRRAPKPRAADRITISLRQRVRAEIVRRSPCITPCPHPLRKRPGRALWAGSSAR
jgi:hypothetical protein